MSRWRELGMPSAKQSWHASHFSNGTRCKIGQTVSTCTQTCMHMHCMHFIVSRDTKNEVLLCALHPTSKHNTDTMILDRHRLLEQLVIMVSRQMKITSNAYGGLRAPRDR